MGSGGEGRRLIKLFLRFGITQTTLGGLLYILLQISCIGRQRKSVKNYNKKLSYCWETMRRESMPRIAEMDVEMTT